MVAALVVVRGTWGPGQVLFRDFVAVPVPARPDGLLPSTAAELRGWPLDAVTWLLAPVVSPGAQQALMLAGALVLAGCGAGVLVRRFGTASAMTAAGLAVWNPYVAERLLLGQPPTLLGYASLPWVVLAARAPVGLVPRLLLLSLAAVPAVLTPWGGVVALVVAVAATLTRRDRRVLDTAAAAGVLLVLCLPWVVPSLLAGGVPADPDGARAFALSDDTGMGVFVSAAMGGGVWAEAAQPLSRTDPVAQAASLLVLAGAVAGLVVVWRTGSRRVWATALVVLLGPAALGAVLSGPAVGLFAAAQVVPGMALVRDQHRMMFPGVLAAALLVAVGIGLVARSAGRAVGGVAAVAALALAAASVVDLPQDVRTAYRPATYPAGWGQVVAALAAGSDVPTVLSMPWQPLRRTGWAPPSAFLDPTPRAVTGTVLVSTTFTVERDGELIVVDDAPRADGPDWSRGVVTGTSLRDNHVTHVVEWLGTPGALAQERLGWTLVVDTPDFRLWDVSSAV